MKQVTVVIPFYKTALTELEKISLNQCIKVLGDYPIIAIKPHSLDISVPAKNINFAQVLSFDETFFESIHGYNRLMLSPDFYKSFEAFEFILIYQLDAFVFRDELSIWCEKGFDYIGAPWLKFPSSPDIIKELKTKIKTRYYQFFNIFRNGLPCERQFDNVVGNGGFSLRRVKKFYQLSLKYESKINEYLNRNEHQFNEDVFWSLEVNRRISRLRIPSYRIALYFAFENRPELSLDYTKNQLPFGCHAWDLHLNFWKSYFAKSGLDIEKINQ